jgi:hypothetical protein
MFVPLAWLIVLPANFIIDSLVILLTMKHLGIKFKKTMYKRTILKVWSFGFLADIIGAAFLFLTMFVFELGSRGDELYLTIPATLIAGILIFILNYKISFKDYDKSVRFKMALNLALLTAPYTFMIPLSWIYG